MIAALQRAYANFRGFDIDGSTVPPMDGPLRPNGALDAAAKLLTLADVDNLAVGSGCVFCSVGDDLIKLSERRVGGGGAVTLEAVAARKFNSQISAIASDSAEALAIGLDGRGFVIQGGRHDGAIVEGPAENRFACITALCFASPDTVLVANGSRNFCAADWKRDLMTKGETGSVWKVDLGNRSGPPAKLADDLRFPSGIAVDGQRILVSEAWRHSIRSIAPSGGDVGTILSGLPAYPGRITRAGDGGYWLAMFAPRNALVEFVLKEEDYRRRMIETIDPAYWIAPSLLAGKSFLEPIQGGTRKKLNMLKPWAPTWSCGLVAKCDSAMRPLASFHSRADGAVHGITSLCEADGNLLATAKGSGLVISLPLAAAAGRT